MSSKVKDGLFLGDIDAAQDAEFLQLNGIVHIINCVPRHVPNLFQQSLGLDYVACDLDEVLKRPFFDLKNRQFMGLVQLIERALEKTESVLVHSLNGINRSPGVMMGFLMVKYCWGVDKAYEFLLTKRADIKPHESYIDQLCLLEAQLQTRFGNRATEQQLYEWHPSLADPSTDEIVLVHTYLNTPSSANRIVAKKEPAKPPSTRRLSWIDQIPQMKKLYPSLMIKPERPPGHSYCDMVPANGWVDLLAPASTSQQHSSDTVPRPIAAFMETAVAKNPPPGPRNDRLDPEDDDASAANRGHRVHSFSVPRRREIELDQTLSPSSTSSDRDDSDLTVDVTPPLASSAPVAPKQVAAPRYQQQQIRSATPVTNRPAPRPSQSTQQPSLQPTASNSRPSVSRGSLSSTNAMSASLPATSAVRSVSSFSGPANGSISSTVLVSSSSLHKPSTAKTADATKPLKPGNRSTTTTGKPPPTSSKHALERRTSNGSFSARGTYTGDLPLPQTTPAFTIRRSIIDTEPWAASFPSSSASATATRPRTAPPRLRKKDSDASVFSTTAKSGGRDVWSLPASGGSSRRLSTAPDHAARTQKPAPSKSTATTAAAATRGARPARAQWK